MSDNARLNGRRHGVGAAVLLALATAGCSAQPDGAGPVSADDQRQLNDAAAMLDGNSVDADVLDHHESSPHD